jgi:hydrogenase-1 operon protein HyaF
MPDAMVTYAMPELPEPEEAAALPEAMAVLRRVLEGLDTAAMLNPTQEPINETMAPGRVGRLHLPTATAGKPNDVSPPYQAEIDLAGLDTANRALVNQTLGEGEVSIIGPGLAIQESVLAGVWRIHRTLADGTTTDTIEIGPIPSAVMEAGQAGTRAALAFDADQLPPGLQNGPSLIAELNEAIAAGLTCQGSRSLAGFPHPAPLPEGRVATKRPFAIGEGDQGVRFATFTLAEQPYVINLSLLPHTPEDLLWLGEMLGTGSVTILSRGYGNCRITSTGTRHVWWVQYFNSQDQLILNTLEVTPVPVVACASREDLEDSRERLEEILQVIG